MAITAGPATATGGGSWLVVIIPYGAAVVIALPL